MTSATYEQTETGTAQAVSASPGAPFLRPGIIHRAIRMFGFVWLDCTYDPVGFDFQGDVPQVIERSRLPRIITCPRC